MRLLAVLILAAACGGGGKPATTPVAAAPPPDPIPATAGPGCDVVADRVATVRHAETPDAQTGARADIAARCTKDAWSDEARSCFATVENDDELDGCRNLLTAAQRDAFGGWGAAGGGAPAPAAAPAPAPPKAKAKRSTRGPVSRESADPEEGGEAKADPEEGGE